MLNLNQNPSVQTVKFEDILNGLIMAIHMFVFGFVPYLAFIQFYIS